MAAARLRRLGGLATILLLALSSSAAAVERTLSVLLAADGSVRADARWVRTAGRILAGVSADFEREFGIRFVVAAAIAWDPEPGAASLEELADDLVSRVRLRDQDIVIALVGRGGVQDPYFGFSLLKDGVVVLRKTLGVGSLTRALKHELAHLFGAVHVEAPDSVMDMFSRGSRFDARNARLIALSRDRGFDPRHFPLPEANWDELAGIYKDIAEAVDFSLVSGRLRRMSQPRRGSGSAVMPTQSLEDAHLMLGQLELERRRYPETVALTRRALRINPENLEARVMAAVALRRSGDYDGAIEEYQAILARTPEHPRVLYNLGVAYSNKGDLESARQVYLRAIERRPGYAEALCNLGDVLLRQGHEEEAEARFRQSLAADPRNALSHANLAEVHFRRGEHDEAWSEVEAALAVDPALAMGYVMRGKLRHAAGELEEAIADYEKAVAFDPAEEKACHNLGNCFLDKNDLEAAEAQFSRAIAIKENFAEAHAGLGFVLLQKGLFERAQSELLRAVALGLDVASVHLNLSPVLLKLGRPVEAADEARAALSLDPSLASGHNNLGIASLYLGDRDAALASFEKARDLDPESMEALKNLGSLYLDVGLVKKARDIFLVIIAREPSAAVVYNNLAVASFRLGQYEAAWAAAEKAESLGHTVHPDLWRELKKKLGR
ncbi:MAG: tetratricopeptide repeat protein [Candidatus Aminicenantes bacterium]|nr:tetratricopeptide repeat protein [Candidatus Aminicenantes bacterium]